MLSAKGASQLVGLLSLIVLVFPLNTFHFFQNMVI